MAAATKCVAFRGVDPSMSNIHQTTHHLSFPVVDADVSKVFGPVPEPGLPWKPTVIPPGARYCEELDAFVPANRPYGIRGIAKRRAPLMERVRTGELFHVESKDEQMTMAFGLTHKTIMLVPLMHAQQSAEIKYRGLEGSENKRVERMTSANGTIHKGLTLVPLEQAQKNVEIKYRGFY